ncbi:tape measure protein [Salmonirosea aquatica]|uniref:Tape measure protein n=1 Tax=Salmonirosea aquatica TaxID=2654236 RepID=A0A7C9FFG5_9BACT|nr:tape measure protein [Cytophagaceae bacterium SJW1-29]
MDQTARFKVSVDSELSEVIAQLGKVASAHEALTSQVGLGNAKIDNAYRSQSLAINKLTTEITKQADAERKAQAERDKATAAHEKSLKQIGTQYDYLGNQVASFKNYLLGAFAVDQILTYGQKILDAAGNMQQFQISLEVMLQSKSKADKLMAEVIEFTKKTPFTLEQTQEATNRLLAYGVASEEVIRTLNSLGNIAAAVGTEKLPQLILAFGQVKAAGHLTGAELRQFQEAGVNMLEALSAATGKSVSTIQKDISKGIISFADVQKALFSLGEEGGRFAGLMVRQSTTITGQLSNLSDSIYQFFARLGNSRTGLIADVTGALQDFFDWMGRSSRNLEIGIASVKSAVSAYVAFKTVLEPMIKAKALLAQQTQATTAATVANTSATVAGTAATGGLSGAVSALWVVFRANPLGFVVGLLSALYSAYQLVTAASESFKEEISFEQLELEKQKVTLEGLVVVAQAHEVGTKRRTDAIKTLISEYPEYFSGINAEKIENSALIPIIDAVSESLRVRINLSREAYRADKLQEKQKELLEQEAELMDRIKNKAPDLYKQIGGDVMKLQDVLKTYTTAQLNALNNVDNAPGFSGKLSEIWSNFTSGSITQVAGNLAKQFGEIEKQYTESAQRVSGIKTEQKEQEIKIENAKHQAILSTLEKGSKEYKAEVVRHNEAVADLEGKAINKSLANIEKSEDKKKAAQKSSLELSLENQVKEIKALEQTQATKLDLLNAEELLMIERAKRTIKGKEDENNRILSIQREYDAKRQKLLESSIDYKMTDLTKLQEQADKEFKIRNELADDIVDLTLHNNGLILKEEEEKAKRLAEIGKEIFEAQKELHRATVELGALDAETNAKFWQNKALVVEKYYRTVLEKDLETARKLEASAQATYDHYLALYGPDDELTRKALENLIKAKTVTTNALKELGENAKKITELTIDDIIKIAQAAMQVVGKLAENFIESSRLAADSIDNVLGMADSAIEANRKALEEQLKDVSLSYEDREKIIGESLNRETELMKRKSALLEIQQQLQDTADKTENTMAIVQSGLNAVVSFAKGDFVGGVVGVIETINLAFQRSAMLQLQEEMKVLRQKQRNTQEAIAELEREMAARTRLHEETLRQIDESEAEFKRGKEAEIKAAQDSFDTQKTLLEQQRDEQVRLLNEQLDAINAYYDGEIAKAREAFAIKQGLDEQAAEDGKRLLEASDRFRNKTLDAWLDRQVKALEDERDRNLQRAQSDEEYRQIWDQYAVWIKDKHTEYEDAKHDKSKAVKLGMEELSDQLKDTTIQNKQDETDKIKQLEDERQDKAQKVQDAILKVNQDTADAISKLSGTLADTVKGLQNSIAANAAKAEADRAKENKDFTDFAMGNQAAIFEQQKQLAVLEIRMEIAKLKAQKRKLFANKRALDAAIAEMEGLIGSVLGGGDGGVTGDWEPVPGGTGGGEGGSGGGDQGPQGDSPAPKFHGTEYLLRMGRPSGRDTIPVMAHEGERIVQSYLNERLMKLRNRPTNAQLVEGYLKYDEFREKFPHMFNLSMPQLSMRLNSLADRPDMPQLNIGYDPALLGEVRRLNSTLENKPGVIVNATKTGLSITERRANSLNRIYTTRYRA